MPVYRITEFTSSDIGKLAEFAESLRDAVAAGDGKGLVVAKYATQAAMDAATDINKQAFGKMIAAGLVNGDSISGKFGEVVFSF